MPSGFNLRQKDISVGSGLNIEYSQTGAGILISAVDTTNTTVHIYDATVDAETGVITITDGTQVADLAIGDEIRTTSGVYQKTKNQAIEEQPADGSRINVTGITNPEAANGAFILTETDNVWKHESADYWISKYLMGSTEERTFWMISAVENAANPGSSLFYGYVSVSAAMPWEVTSWSRMSSATGTPVLENAAVQTVITNTIDLFEYASTSVASSDIVQSVNGNKPDASGNVTIETSSGGLTSVSVGNGLTGNGTSSNPVTLDLSDYSTESDISLYTAGPYSISLLKGLHGITIDGAGITLKSTDASIALGVNITYNDNPPNTAGGFAIVESNGKLPSSILPDSSIDLSDYSTTSNISLKTTGSSTGITLGSTSGIVSLYSGYNGNGLTIDSNSCSCSSGNVSLSGTQSTSVGNDGMGTTTINVLGLSSLMLKLGSTGTVSPANTANGFAIVESNGKLPRSILPESTVDLSNYTGALNITATSNASIRGGTSGNYDITIGDSSHGVTVYAAQNNPTVSITSFGSTGNIDLNSANINVGGSSGSTKITLKSSNVSVEPTTGGGTFSVDVTSSGSVKFTAGNIYFNNNVSNTAGGFAIVGEDGKLPSSIIPVSGNRHPFTSSDLSSNVLTITTTGNVTGVIDDSGKAWNFADEEVTYTDSTVSVDLSGVLARKGIVTPSGTWKLMLYGA